MAKKGGKTKAKKPGKVRVASKVRAALDKRALAAARAIADPCNAPLEPGVYPGQAGIITRFALSTQFALTATQTAFIQAINPAAMIGWGVGATDGNTAVSPSFNQFGVPGAAFVNTNARCGRALGACIEFFTNAAPLNAQGTFYYGVLPHSNVANNFTTIGNATSNVQFMSKVNADAYEVKWRPGVLDNQWTTVNNNLSAAEWDDKNTLVVMGTGFPVSSSITLKVTIIYEWLPMNGLGLSTPSASAGTTLHTHSSVVAALDSAHPNWWGGKVGDAANFVWKHGGQQLASFFTQGAARYVAAKALPYMGGALALTL